MGKQTKLRGLTPKQERFVEEYLVDLNATQAAIRAGYSAKTADRSGPELLGKTCVAEAITKARTKLSDATGIKQERVLRELAAAGFNDIRDAITWTKESVHFIPSEELPEHVARAIESIEAETKTYTGPTGDPETSVKLKLKFCNKLTALDQISKHLAFYAPVKQAQTDKAGNDIDHVAAFAAAFGVSADFVRKLATQ